MSKNNNKYLRGKIYKIIAYETDDVYIGSTTRPLKTRYSAHKSNFKCWINTKKQYCSSAKMFERHGLDNCKIELIENCVCNSKRELEGREAHFIDEYDSCVNMNKPCRTKAQYRIDNKDKINKKSAQYKIDNKDKLARYYINNKAKLIAKIKQYQDNNKNKIVARMQMKFDCKCGGKYTYNNKGGHVQSERHQKYLM